MRELRLNLCVGKLGSVLLLHVTVSSQSWTLSSEVMRFYNGSNELLYSHVSMGYKRPTQLQINRNISKYLVKVSYILVFAGRTPTVLAAETLLNLILLTIFTEIAGAPNCSSSVFIGNRLSSSWDNILSNNLICSYTFKKFLVQF